MLPVSPPYQPSASQGSLYATNQPFPTSQSFPSSQSLSFSDVMGTFDSRTFSQQAFTGEPSFTNAEYNTPDIFKQNMHIALELLARVQGLARSALLGIEQAYRPGNNFMQTADIAALKQVHQALIEQLRASGVGALPLLVGPSAELPSEQKLVEEVTKAVQILYDRQKRLQESAATVANLLSITDAAQGKVDRR